MSQVWISCILMEPHLSNRINGLEQSFEFTITYFFYFMIASVVFSIGIWQWPLYKFPSTGESFLMQILASITYRGVILANWTPTVPTFLIFLPFFSRDRNLLVNISILFIFSVWENFLYTSIILFMFQVLEV